MTDKLPMVDNEKWLKDSLFLFQEETKTDNKGPDGILQTEVKAESKKVCRWVQWMITEKFANGR